MATMLNSIKRYNETTEKSLNLDDLPKSVNELKMSEEELYEKLREGFLASRTGHNLPVKEAFARLRAKYNI